jgi:protein-S-isoprenylcysteine O-methyltransferase Ste14
MEKDMTPYDWLAAIVLLMHLEIPVYWLIVHPNVRIWAGHKWAAYILGAVAGWGIPVAILVVFQRSLFARAMPALWKVFLGVALLAIEARILWQVFRDLGIARLVGKTELSRDGELAQSGIYAHLRHPRYVGSACAVVGACLLRGSEWMWSLAGAWACLTLLVVLLEEHELRARFGAAYDEYASKVPRFIPLGSHRHR